MRTREYRKTVFVAAVLAALLLPQGLAAQVEEARVRIDGMV
jgi:hypothetical protein